MKYQYASPVNENNKLHFSDSSLIKMISILRSIDNKVTKVDLKPKQMYTVLNNYLTKYCGKNKYWLWCVTLEKLSEKKINNLSKLQKIRKDLKLISKKDLKPEKPDIWYKHPKTWLSNYDIQNVMTQYEAVPKYSFAFLGVFPIDFAVSNTQGQCLYSDFCNIDISKMIKKKKKFIGFITNLDKHDESGSHWTSTFISIDPSIDTYGAYYYDSVAGQIPHYLISVLKHIKTQCDKLYPDKVFKINFNKKRHQYKNSECGVFSILYQIRWLNKHIVKDNKTSFEEIIRNPNITDDTMLKVRDELFRPNTKRELLQNSINI
jgi:hypothetical protein